MQIKNNKIVHLNICYFKILKISNSVWMSMLLNGAKQLRLCANLYRCASYGSKNIIEIRLDLYLLCGCFSLFPVIHCLFNLFQHIKCCWSNVYIASSKLWVVFKPSCVHFALIEFFVYHNMEERWKKIAICYIIIYIKLIIIRFAHAFGCMVISGSRSTGRLFAIVLSNDLCSNPYSTETYNKMMHKQWHYEW